MKIGKKTYNLVNGFCIAAAVAAVIIFGRFEGSDLVAGALGAVAAVVSTITYFWNRFSDFGSEDGANENATRADLESRDSLVKSLVDFLSETVTTQPIASRELVYVYSRWNEASEIQSAMRHLEEALRNSHGPLAFSKAYLDAFAYMKEYFEKQSEYQVLRHYNFKWERTPIELREYFEKQPEYKAPSHYKCKWERTPIDLRWLGFRTAPKTPRRYKEIEDDLLDMPLLSQKTLPN